jgi:hypothetical protein
MTEFKDLFFERSPAFSLIYSKETPIDEILHNSDSIFAKFIIYRIRFAIVRRLQH